MKAIYRNSKGELEVDPTDYRGTYEKWLAKIKLPDGTINYQTIPDVSPIASKLITQHILDLSEGRNLAKCAGRGTRSYAHLVNLRTRLHRIIHILEKHANKEFIHLSEDEVLNIFKGMREGRILTLMGTPFLSTDSYAKRFASLWRWYIRINKKEGKAILDIVDNLDTQPDHKPKWHSFTLKGAEKMYDIAHNLFYKALILFLFDSGIRAPRELMNVRVCDLSRVLDTDNQYFLQIRDDTSKTFGRKIKLMICGDVLQKYIDQAKLKYEDFLFAKSYPSMTRMLAVRNSSNGKRV